MDRLNRIKQYIDFYNKNKAANPLLSGLDAKNQVNRDSFDWAVQQSIQDAQDYRPETPNFFSNMGSGMGGMRMAQNNQESQYQPYYQQRINPYSERATQLNNDPYSGQGNQNGIMNYLRRMMGGSGQIGQGQGMTVGIRG